MATFAGVGIQAAYCDHRFFDAEHFLQARVQDVNHAAQAFRRNVPADLGKRQVSRNQSDAQLTRDEQHDRVYIAAHSGQEFRVTGKRDACLVDDALVHRSGHQCVKSAVQDSRAPPPAGSPVRSAHCPG